MQFWGHQRAGIDQTLAALARGERRLCLTSPTGGGKTLMVQEIARQILERRNRVALYSNRKLLIDQLSESCERAGISHGVRAAGHEAEHSYLFQVCSIATENIRSIKRKQQDLHACQVGDLAIFDEGHLHCGPTACKIRQQHIDGGASTMDVTATPIDMGSVCDKLIVAGTTTELQKCGALVPAIHFGPDEPDMRAFKKLREGEDLSENDVRKAMITPSIWGRVWEWFERLNPDHKPSILFAPGVRESIWFAEQFSSRGVRAAHIDGNEVWLDGKLHKSSRELRQEVLNGSACGDIRVLCNRFVLREGIDAPWLAHGILATVFGALQSYLQSGGRLLRAHHSLGEITIQDHGGNWWRHGSLNSDRQWSLTDTATSVYGLRADRLRAKKLAEPVRCPKCALILICGRCRNCGFEAATGKRSRPVVSTDGSLKDMTGHIFRPRRLYTQPNGPAMWERMYWRSCTEKGRRSFRSAAAMFAVENNWGWPNPAWPFMPIDELDWFLKVDEVPFDRLVPKPAEAA